MNSVKMVASENLLQSVIISQNADMMNGIRELIQNGLDSYFQLYNQENRLLIDLEGRDENTGQYSTLIYRDYGMTFGNTREEVISNFFVFGNSGKSAEQLGKFGIGRGQIMAMIYDPDSKTMQGTHTIKTGKFIISDIDILNLTANITENDVYVDGTEWTIHSYDAVFIADDIRDFISEKIISSVEIYFNKELVSTQIQNCVKYGTELFDLYIDDKSSNSNNIYVYERGIYCGKKMLRLGFSGYLITKVPLELNFARNEIVNNQVYKDILKGVDDLIYKYAQKDTTKLDDARRAGLLGMLIEKPTEFSYLEDLPIVKLANNTIVKFNAIKKAGKLYRGGKESRCADVAISAGYHVVDDDSPLYYGGHDLLTTHGIKKLELEDSEKGVEFKKSTFAEVEKLTEYEIRMLSIMNSLAAGDANGRQNNRVVKVGVAEAAHLAWTDGSSIWINRVKLDELSALKNDEARMCYLLPLIAHEYAHYGADTTTDNHDYSFYERLATVQDTLVQSYLTTLHS